MENGLVSIIIPIYNVEKYIIRCLKSVTNQTYKNIEIILVDDCGKDQSKEKALAYLQSVIDVRYKFLSHNFNMGLSEARHTGVRESSGEYLFFLDSDDELPSNAIFSLVYKIETDQAQVVIGGMNWIYATHSEMKCEQDNHIIGNTNILIYSIKHTFPLVACNKLIRRFFFIDNKLFFKAGIYHEDLLWSYNLLLRINDVSILSANTYNYWIHGDSITTSIFTAEKLNSFLTIIDEMSESNLNDIYRLSLFRSRYYSMLEIICQKGNINDLKLYRTHVLENISNGKLFYKLCGFKDLLKVLPQIMPIKVIKYYVLLLNKVRGK